MSLLSIFPFRWPAWTIGLERPRHAESDPPLHAELFSVEQLARHARTLAAGHRVMPQAHANRLLARLDENELALRAYNQATRSVPPTRRITPAAEWLLDNFYLLEEQIHLARRHLPRGYSRELPRLSTGPSAGLPRVYDIVLELITHVDAQIEAEPLRAFIAAYQTSTSLKLGELWAIPVMLRLGLIENLQRVIRRLTVAREDRDLAGQWVDRLQDQLETHPCHLVVVVADLAKSDPPMSSSFVAEFCQRLSQQNPVLPLARGWLEQRLAEQGLTIEQLIQLESQNQAADQVTVRHSLASLRFLSAMNWKDFVEGLSLVETILRTDPAGVYGGMDFATRDRYRHAVEFLARHSRRPEADIAGHAIALATEGAQLGGRADRKAHVGYALIDRGRRQLDRQIGLRRPWGRFVEHLILRSPLVFYAGSIGLITALATGWFIHQGRQLGLHGGGFALLTAAYLLAVSQLAVTLTNWLATVLIKPRLLPRLDFTAGIPPDCRTLVVVPTMLTDPAGVTGLVETLELHHLANRDPNLCCALLTDFCDAAAEHQPEDAALVQLARDGVERLNRRYCAAGPALFYLFHRPRRWNNGERRWMGYERKRGKLTEFNHLLRGGAADRFALIVGDPSLLPEVKYVITLDTDTQLPRDAARQLAGTMAHPLNRPVFDVKRGIVTEGYGILQPRVGVNLPSARRSWFVRMFATDAGIDPYTREVSDVYQDVFREGSFIGKGIYDVDAFERALTGRVPENAVLSHDLLEACHARSALVSDVVFYEDFPARYNVDVARRHRWIRGDWQIAPWLLPRVRGSESDWLANPLSALSQWKILDNLRRSLVPPALLLVLTGHWLLCPGPAHRGALLVMTILVLPGLLAALLHGLVKPADLPWRLHGRGVTAAAGRQLLQIFLLLVFLPYDAYLSADAIFRTLLRLLVTRRRLLEWQTSGESESAGHASLAGFYATMWIAPAVAGVCGFLLLRLPQPAHLFAALPLLALWLAAPGLAWRISQPIPVAVPDLSTGQRLFLRRTARRTWHYFERFVTVEENWLPPDNFQEVPVPTVAARTSPTNIGLALLANLAAQDLGYLPAGGLIQRTQDTLATLQRLERFHGHFYNWYDTRTLQPLPPLYLSSVDSGNLAGHLLTLGAGLREQAAVRPNLPQILAGLRDTLGILRELRPDEATLAGFGAELAQTPPRLPETCGLLARGAAVAAALTPAGAETGEPAADWARTLQRNCEEQRAELLFLAPWLSGPDPLQPGAAAGAAGLPATLPSGESWASRLDQPASLQELARWSAAAGEVPGPPPAALGWSVREAGDRARQRLLTLENLARQCDELAAMDFAFHL